MTIIVKQNERIEKKFEPFQSPVPRPLSRNSLFLHSASPSAHHIATSKVAATFTGRLKRGNKGLFCSPNAFDSDCDHFTRLKKVRICLETGPSPLAQNDHLKPKSSLSCRFEMKREG